MEKDWVVLKIDDRRMWASLTIKEPEGEEEPYFSPEFIEAYLRGNGITAGILKENIEALSNCVAYGQETIVARGKEPVKGRDGFYTYMVVLEDCKNKPTINSDGTVDYYNSLRLAMVEEGDVFAVYEPATAGEYGYTIFSEMLSPLKGRDLRPLRGRGFTMSEDRKTYTASFGGRIFRQDERIIIEKIYIVKGDLDIEQGNIKFNGDVEVKGDVRSGLTIETDGDIFVHGHVGGCNLTAGGSITIRKGIQGRNKCEIIAGRDVACSFIERCRINAKGSVYADSILDSEVVAREMVKVCSKKGLIVGGNVTGIQGVEAKNVGNDVGVLTTLYTGVLHDDIVKLSEIDEKIQKIKGDVEILDKNLKIYDSLDGSRRTKETEAVRMKILRAKVLEAAELKKLQDQHDALELEISTARKDAIIHITGVVYAGTKVCIGRSSLVTKESFKDVIYKSVNEEVVQTSGGE